MRIASLLPSATEIAFILGLGDSVVGVTHECDFPEEARARAVLTRSLLRTGLSSAEIEAAVVASQRDAHTIYALDAELLARLEPDFVLTQSLCEVCAVPRETVEAAVCTMPRQARVVSLDPSSIWEVLADIERVGAETGMAEMAREVVEALKSRIEAVRSRTAALAPPRVFCAEWLEPIFCAGHWLPEMVQIAGGDERIGRANTESVRIPWEKVLDYEPEVIVMMPCGFDANGALGETHWLTEREGWATLPAVRDGRVYVVDANAYYARPGPRLVDGVEILARLLHPEVFETPLEQVYVFKLTRGSTDCFEAYL
jgi:iron complex transport system substrate-binding protein